MFKYQTSLRGLRNYFFKLVSFFWRGVIKESERKSRANTLLRVIVKLQIRKQFLRKNNKKNKKSKKKIFF